MKNQNRPANPTVRCKAQASCESRKFRAVKSVGKKGEGLPVECLARGTRSRTPRQKRVLLQYLPSGPQHLQEGGPQRKPAKAQHHQYHCERLDDQVADWQAHDFAPSRTSDSRTFLYVKQFSGPCHKQFTTATVKQFTAQVKQCFFFP